MENRRRNMFKCNEKIFNDLKGFLESQKIEYDELEITIMDGNVEVPIHSKISENDYYYNVLKFKDGIVTNMNIIENFTVDTAMKEFLEGAEPKKNYKEIKEYCENLEKEANLFFGPTRIYNLGVNVQRLLNDFPVGITEKCDMAKVYEDNEKVKLGKRHYLKPTISIGGDKVLLFIDETYYSYGEEHKKPKYTVNDYKVAAIDWISEKFFSDYDCFSKTIIEENIDKYIEPQSVDILVINSLKNK